MAILTILIIILLAEVSYLIYREPRSSSVRTSGSTPIFIDTSALMDGRVVTAAQTGFLSSPVVIPHSVIDELQLLADQGDAEKRSRARRGLDAIKELQDIAWLEVRIIQDGPTGPGGVDSRLVELATKQRGAICTIDFNLNKVASVQGIRVLNINELAGSIRMAFLPGETISLPLTQKGQNATQAVGYLADGTMVVVEKAAGQIGKVVEIEFIRSLQTAAGRMMFAKLVSQTRGEAKGEGRMVAKSESSDRQTRGEAKGEGDASTKAQPKITKARDTAKGEGRKPLSADKPIEAPARSTEQPRKPQPRAQSTSQRRNQRSRTRRTGEDSLIELVNKQD